MSAQGIFNAAEHPRGYHGRFGRSTTRKRMGVGDKAPPLQKPMLEKTRRLKEAATVHHNMMLFKKHVLSTGDGTSELQARYRLARRLRPHHADRDNRFHAKLTMFELAGSAARKKWFLAPKKNT